MAAPDLKLDVSNGIPDPKDPNKRIWLKCGAVSLWQDRSGRWTGKLRLNILSHELNLFEQNEFQEEQNRKPLSAKEDVGF